MPKQQQIETPLLAALDRMGGRGRPQEVYAAVTKAFPELTEADLAERLESGGNRWKNRIQWVRQRLVERGELESPSYGIWAITSKGSARLRGEAFATQPVSTRQSNVEDHDPTPTSVESLPSQIAPINFEETVEDYSKAFIAKLLQKLLDLTPEKFEEFAAVLLKGYGFQKVVVTGKSGDGGIDGHGELKVGLAVLKAAFQCKRWNGEVGSKEVQAFRGAIQGQFEQGYFFTTSTFSKPAQTESLKIGAAPVILFDGEQIGQIMIEKGIGIRRRPVELYEDQIEDLFETK